MGWGRPQTKIDPVDRLASRVAYTSDEIVIHPTIMAVRNL
jgi:hypothetical protein